MTKEPEFIISDNMIRQWRGACIKVAPFQEEDQCKDCEYRGKGARKGCCDFDDDAMEKIFRSRPYNEQEIIPNLHSCLYKEIWNGIEFCHYHNKEIHATLTEHDEKIRQAAINGVLDRAVKAIERQERAAENEKKRSGLTLAIYCIDAIRESIGSDAELRQQSGEQQRGQRD